MSDRQTVWLAIGAVVAVIALSVGVWVLSSYFEARAYENVTGKHVSTWDAMFLDLRVQEQPK